MMAPETSPCEGGELISEGHLERRRPLALRRKHHRSARGEWIHVLNDLVPAAVVDVDEGVTGTQGAWNRRAHPRAAQDQMRQRPVGVAQRGSHVAADHHWMHEARALDAYGTPLRSYAAILRHTRPASCVSPSCE